MGYTLGKPGGSLGDGDAAWMSANRDAAKAGADAERKTAAVLDERARATDAVVLHDLRIPLPGYKANIDHVWVSGDRVLVMDTKRWTGGFYWTLFGKTYRGFKAFPYADKKTIPAAVAGLEKFLGERGIRARFSRPFLIVWSSKPLNGAFYRPVGAKYIGGDVFKAGAVRILPGKKADVRIVNALQELLN